MAGLVLANPVRAQAVDDDVWIRAEAYFPNVDTEVSIARPGQENFTTLIDLESDLDLSDRDVLPALTIGKKISQHWRAQFEFYRLNRSGTKTLDRQIVFDGVTYPVAASLESAFKSDVYHLSVGYGLIKEPNFEAGVALGVHATKFEISLEGMGQVGTAAATTELRTRDMLAPLPTVGAYLLFRPAPRFGIGGKADYLSLKIGDYKGLLVNLQADATYAITEHIRIGGMYRYVKYRVDIEKPAYTGRIAYKFHGPAAFLELAW
ncbi:hypothetical protein GRI89_03300 [Altererythrobacter salegens]|uniref:Outer membrane protein beta-barrel domain-containing protein n=1 Tax=Croceibacterium salegens TaxID=1737568 RepID=A0A6I4ST83_9SPHN|nr:hypothetical protein [Croceibacterium salegens]MXO58568.1 hypothetical protein [Croceibacterium salegens]